MAKEDEEKTSFHVEGSSYCFKRMPSGLQNIEATYKKLIRSVFEKQLGKNMRIHGEYLVTQSKTEEALLHDVEETLMELRKINLKLNPTMCSFGIEMEESNEHMFVRQTVKTNPINKETSSELQTQRIQRRKQNLKINLEILKAFLSKGVNRSSPLYKVRNEVIDNLSYQWNKEAEASFQRWKSCMEILPTVTPPTRGEVLFLHIAMSPDEIGTMLFVERKHLQISIYFVSRALPYVEQDYAASEKLILALIHATRRLRKYFKDHTIRVLTDKPFERLFLNPDGTRRMVKWAKELEEYNIEYGENDPFEGQSNEPAETCESSMSYNKKASRAKQKEHHINDSKVHLIPHNQEHIESGTEQQASTK